MESGSPIDRVRALLRQKFQRDVMWNIAGLGVAAVSGMALNTLIGAVYGAAALGAFNQVFASFIFFSQIAVLGVHHSVLKHVAAARDRREAGVITTTGLLLAVLLAVVVSAGYALAAQPIAAILASPAVARGIVLSSPGLLCFAINKVILAHLNGTRSMRLYAVFQAGRIVLMLGGFVVCERMGVTGDGLAVVLTIGEAGILLLSLPTVVGQLARPRRSELRQWLRTHLDFGLRGFLSGVLIELNTRVDVLMLGIFASDAVVGGYSFAAIFAEGFYQLLVVLRSNYNPVLVRLLADGDGDGLRRAVARGKRAVYAIMAALGAVAVAVYWLGIPFLTSSPELIASWPVFAILVAGIVLSAGYTPFNQILLQAGRPGWHTVMVASVVAFNALANVALIWQFGAHGAALATAAAFVFSVFALKLMSRTLLDLRL
jgi:O-antigen/teichoic acid export membrane protein